jgi:glycosyltransferase involved in cell wall biosynthesis
MKQIAVVIPLYNHAAYIGDAIRSVLAQTRPVDRVLVIDDGSTDNSIEVVRTFKDPRIELQTQTNAGADSALNRGIEAADTCEYIAILNSDDLFAPERVLTCTAFLDETPNVDVVATRMKLIDGAGNDIPPSESHAKWFRAAWSLRRSHLDLVEQLGVANFIASTSNLIGRRRFFLEHPFRHYRYVHDYYFLLEGALHERLAVIDEELLSYRVHSANTIAAAPRELVRELLEMNLDLLVSIAPELDNSPRLRHALAIYHRATWANISSFRADVFASLLARALAGCSRDQMQASIDAVMEFAEAKEFPNQVLLNLADGEPRLGAGLAEKYSRLAGELRQVKAELAALRKTRRASRWLRVGRKSA